MTKYLIFGNGFIGNKFHDYLNESVLSAKHIASMSDAESEIIKHKPKIVINCIGKTGRPNVDWCENHKEETMDANVIVPYHIMQACLNNDARFVTLGTGCMYEGDNNGKGFTEEDKPNFFGSFYSRTKIISQTMLCEFDVLQLRLRMPLDDSPGERNLLTKILGYNKIINAQNSASYMPDCLRIAKELMNKKAIGIFNLVNKGSFSHNELLEAYAKEKGSKPMIENISTDQLDKITSARRSNCVLSTKKIEDLGIRVPEIHDAISRCVKNYCLKEASQ